MIRSASRASNAWIYRAPVRRASVQRVSFRRPSLFSARPRRTPAPIVGLVAIAVALLVPAMGAAQCSSGQAFFVSQSRAQILDFPSFGSPVNLAASPLTSPRDILVGGDGLVYVVSFDQNAVYRFSQSGAYLGEFVSPGSGGLAGAYGMAFSRSGQLFVVSTTTNEVLQYDSNGSLLGVFVPAAGALSPQEAAIATGPGGNLFIGFQGNGSTEIREYDPSNGNLLRTFPVTATGPTDIIFDRSGTLQVAAHGGVFALNRTTGVLTTTIALGAASRPTALGLGPQGLLYVAERLPNRLLTVADPVSGTVLSQSPAPGTLPKSMVLPCALSLGDFTFLDNNDDGSFGPSDVAAPSGIAISLLDPMGNPIDGDPVALGIQPATTTTNGQGHYRFDSLFPGDYTVQVDASNFAAAGPLAGLVSSTATTNSTGLTTENNLDHGINTAAPANTGITSGVVTLSHDVEPLAEGLPNGGPGFATDDDSDLTIDFGFVQHFVPAFDLALIKQLATGQATTVQAGDDVNFTIIVINQGDIDATGVILTDTIPTGFILSPSDTNGWVSSGTTATVPLAGTLLSGTSVPVNLVLEVTNTAALGTAINFAEISAALDDMGNPVTDIDSTPDASSGNTQGEQPPALEDDQVGENGNNPGEDEDDHDPASVDVTAAPVFDLALIKQLATGQATTVQQGDDVNFTITVINQGDIDATGVILTDTIPTGFILSPSDTNGWVSNGTIATVPLAGTLLSGTSVPVNLVLEVTNTAALGTAINFAEISAALDDMGNPVTDIDSTPDGSSGNTQGEQPPALEDDQVGEDGNNPGEDEDDHDPASVNVTAAPVFDLALIKQLATGQATLVDIGDDVAFTITVINQGDIDATDVTVTDTIPPGFILSPNNTNAWVSGGTTATLPLAGTLVAGTSVPVGIVLEVTNTAAVGTAINFAEISAALDDMGNPVTDIDSTPDGSSGNTQGEQPPALEDDQVGENGNNPGEDEDDHDFASVNVAVVPGDFDLALMKQLATGQAPLVDIGDDVNFTIAVINQGDIDATGITVTDTPPPGFTLSANDTNGWSISGMQLMTSLPGTLASGTSVSVDLLLTVTPSAPAGNNNNFAEISSALDDMGNPVSDIDSTPDGSSGNTPGEQPPALEDDQVGENGNNPGEDEDDHDFASVSLLPTTPFDVLSVGNVVWIDMNGDGMQDGNEPRVPGVALRILDSVGNPVNPAILGDNEIQVTDANGEYRFIVLSEGTFLIEVLPQNFDDSGPLAGLTSSSGQMEENDPNADGDRNDNGIDDVAPRTNGIRSNPVVLTLGAEPMGEAGNPGNGILDDNSNLTVDFGFVTGGGTGLYAVPGPFGGWLLLFAGLLSGAAFLFMRRL